MLPKLQSKLLIIYGCRTWELCGALKVEFDFETMVWSVPPDRVKNNRWLILPITPLAKDLFDKLWIYSRDSKYIFPGRYNEEKTINKTSVAHAIARLGCVSLLNFYLWILALMNCCSYFAALITCI